MEQQEKKSEEIYLAKPEKVEQIKKGRKIPEAVVLIAFIAIITVILFMLVRPFLTGYITKESTYIDALNLKISDSQEYNWKPENSGIISSLRVSGDVEGEGNARVYIKDRENSYLIYDSEKGKSLANALTGLVLEPTQEEQQQAEQEINEQQAPSEQLPEQVPAEQSLEQPAEIPVEQPVQEQPLETPTEAQPVEENITEEQPVENITLPEEIKKEKFDDICDETCIFEINQTEYTLVLEVDPDTTLNLKKIIYTIKKTEEDLIKENITEELIISIENLTAANITLANITEVQYETIQEDAEIQAVIDSVNYDNETNILLVNFHHESNDIQPISIISEYSLDYQLSANEAAANENITLAVNNWNPAKYFEIKIGSHSQIIGIGEIPEYDVNTGVKGANGEPQNVSVGFEKPVSKEKQELSNGKIKKGEYDIKIKPSEGSIKEISINNVNINESVGNLISIDTNVSVAGYVKSYAIDPTIMIEFTYANVTVTALGNELYKCKDWNFTEQNCFGEWVKLMDIVPGQEYTFTLTAEDPGFGEIASAQHLDENKTFISDVSNETRVQDSIWSEPIYHNHYIRATFESNLTTNNIIKFYVRNNQSLKTSIEVYNGNSSDLLGSTDIITTEGNYDFEMPGNNNVLDFKIVNAESASDAYLGFDYIGYDFITGVQEGVTIFEEDFTPSPYYSYNWTRLGTDWDSYNGANCYGGSGDCAHADGTCTEAQDYILTHANLINLTSAQSAGVSLRAKEDTDFDAGDWLRVWCLNSTGGYSKIYEEDTGNWVSGGTWRLINANVSSSCLINTRFKITIIADNSNEDLYIDDFIVTKTTAGDAIPSVNLISPANGNVTASNNVTFVCNATDDYKLSNMTFYWNYSGNFIANGTTAVTGIFNQTSFSRTGLNNGAILWGCRACDNLSQCSFSSNRTVTMNYTALDSYPIWSNNQTSIVITYSSTPSLFNITWQDDVGVSLVRFESNYSGSAANYTMNLISGSATNGVYHYNATLPAGTFYWKSNANDTANQKNSSSSWQFTINKAASQVNLTLNGTKNNISISTGTALNLSCSRINGEGIIQLYNNGGLINSGVSISNLTAFASAGYYNITCIYSATQNYSSSLETYYVNATIADSTPPSVSLIAPANSSQDSDGFVTFQYNVTDESNINNCKLIFNGAVDQTGTSITKGQIQQFTKSGLSNGNYNWRINCTDSYNNQETSELRYFTVSLPQNYTNTTIIVNETIRDSSGNPVSATIAFIDTGSGATDYNSTSGTTSNISSGTFDIKITLQNNPIQTITFVGTNITGNITDIVDISNSTGTGSWANFLGINPLLNYSYSYINITVHAAGKNLYKCANWNFSSNSCIDERWKRIMRLVPGQNYSFIIQNSTDPGFGELNSTLNVLDYQDYLINSNQTILRNQSDIYDVQVNLTDNVRITQVNIYNYNNSKSLDDLKIQEGGFSSPGYVSLYSVDTSNLSNANITVTVMASETDLYKCNNWDFSSQTCLDGNWALFKTGLVPGQIYSFILFPGDPGFAGALNTTYYLHNESDSQYSAYQQMKNVSTDLARITSAAVSMTPVGNKCWTNKWIAPNSTLLNAINGTWRFTVYVSRVAGGSGAPTAGLFGRIIKINNSGSEIEIANSTKSANIGAINAATAVSWSYNLASGSNTNISAGERFGVQICVNITTATTRTFAINWENTTPSNIIVPVAFFITSPVVHLISPANNTITNVSSQTFSCNITSTGIANLTLSIWNSTGALNYTNTTALTGTTVNSTNWTFALPYDNSWKWNCLGRNTLNDQSFSAEGNYTVTLDRINPAINFTSPTEISGSSISRRNIQINVTASDTNLKNITIFLYNSTRNLINSSNSTSGTLFANFSVSADGIYFFNATAFDNAGNLNNTETRNVTIALTAPQWSNNKTSPASGVSYTSGQQYQFNITWTDNALAGVLFENNFNGTLANYSASGNLSTEYFYNYANLAAGTYLWRSCANNTAGNLNCTSQFTFVVNKAAQSITPLLNGVNANLSVTYPQQINASYSGTNQTAVSIKINGTSVNIAQNYTWGAGVWDVNYSMPANQNYSSFETHLNLTINPASDIVNLYLNGQQQNISLIYPNKINATASSESGTHRVYRGVTDITASEIGLNITLGVGTYIYKVNSTGNLNYSANTTGMTFSVQINQSASSLNLTLNKTQGNISIYQNGIINLNCSLINPTTGILQLYNNGTLINSGNSPIGNLTAFNAAGLFNISCYYASTQNASSSSATYYVNVTDNIPPIFNSAATKPQLNAVYNQTNVIPLVISVNENSTVFANVSFDSASQIINLIFNGTQGYYTSTFTNTTYPGIYSVVFNASDIYGNSNTTFTNFTIRDIISPAVSNIMPAAGSSYNQSQSINITANVTDYYYDSVGSVISRLTYPNGTSVNYILTEIDNSQIFDNLIFSSILAGRYNLTIIANDSSGNVNSSSTSYFIINDITSPKWSNNKTNANSSTRKGANVYFNITLMDENLGGYYIFAYDNGSGIFANSSATAWNNQEVSVIKIITATRGQIVRWYFWFNDSSGNFNQTDIGQFVVANTPPVAGSAHINPSSPNVTSNLYCNYTYSDADADSESGTAFAWYKDNILQAGLILQTVNSGNLTDNDTWMCKITPKDGFGFGNALNSTLAMIGGSNPAIVTYSANSNGTDPKNVGSNVTFTVDWSDPDQGGAGGEIARMYICNSSSIDSSGCADRTICSTSNAAADPVNCDYTALQSDNTTADYWVLVCDDTNLCSGVSSGTFNINHAPYATVVNILPTNPKVTDNLTCSYSFNDLDGDSENESATSFKWFKNNVLQAGQTDQMLDSSLLVKNDAWKCEVKVVDQFNFAGVPVNSTDTLIESSAPAIVSITDNSDSINPTNVGSNVTFALNWSDPDQPAENVSLYVCNSDSITISGCADRTFCSVINSSKDPINCNYTAIQTDNTTESYWAIACDLSGLCSAISSQGTFEVNHVPVMSAISLAPATAYRNDTLTCSGNYSDQDLDNAALSYVWFNNSVVAAGQNASSFDCNSFGCIKHSNITCQIIPTDQNGFSGIPISATRSISNSLPYLISNIPDQNWLQNSENDNAFNLSSYFADIDNDALIFSVTGNTNITVSINPITSSVNFSQPAGFTGTEYVIFIANDSESIAYSNNVSLTVSEIPSAGGGGRGCTANWQCSEWSSCINGQQTRTCTDSNNCGTVSGKPAESQLCTVVPIIPTPIPIPAPPTATPEITPEGFLNVKGEGIEAEVPKMLAIPILKNVQTSIKIKNTLDRALKNVEVAIEAPKPDVYPQPIHPYPTIGWSPAIATLIGGIGVRDIVDYDSLSGWRINPVHYDSIEAGQTVNIPLNIVAPAFKEKTETVKIEIMENGKVILEYDIPVNLAYEKFFALVDTKQDSKIKDIFIGFDNTQEAKKEKVTIEFSINKGDRTIMEDYLGPYTIGANSQFLIGQEYQIAEKLAKQQGLTLKLKMFSKGKLIKETETAF